LVRILVRMSMHFIISITIFCSQVCGTITLIEMSGGLDVWRTP